jgi:cell division protein FtsB
VLALIAYLYFGPARDWISTYREADVKRAEVAALQAENRELRKRKRDFQQPQALEREARKLGMVKAGERAYVVRGLPR